MYCHLSKMQDHADARCEANASFEKIGTYLQDVRREACHNYDELRHSMNILQSDNAKLYDHLAELKVTSVGNLREVHDHLDRIESLKSPLHHTTNVCPSVCSLH